MALPDSTTMVGSARCWGCQTGRLDCVVKVNGRGKCAACYATECSFHPSPASSADLQKLQSAWDTMRSTLPILRSERAEATIRAEGRKNIERAMADLERVAMRFGALKDEGKALYHQI